ncbi:hypothetical protein [Thiohalophilus sp.]|uniref:hypothetical protein n=1 Tax=Thiohalophilus sp. TaxID=3028392 RepID=UPI003974B8A2
MNFLRILVIFSLSLSFTGCAYLHSFDSNLPEKIDQWIEEEQYGKAMDTLEHVREDNRNYALLMKQKARILSLAAKLAKETIARARQLVARNEWYNASQLYQEALRKYPDSEALQNAYEDFINKRQTYLAALETRLLINKGNWLKQNASIYSRVKAALPDNYRSVDGIRDYESDQRRTTQSLVECALTADSADNINLARQCVLLAERLEPALKQDPRLASIRERIGEAREARLTQYKDLIIDLMAELRQGNSLDNLQRARDRLQSSGQYGTLDDETLELLDNLRKRLQQGINQRMESARRLYSQGKIQQALQIWESLHSIDPGNQQLEAYIERARRVLEKLQRLQQEGSVISPPALQN